MTEHEELLMLRALAAKQAQELEASKRIIAERDEKIRKQNIQIDNMIQTAFFFYSRSRSGENARKLLKDFDGYLITDAYSGYDTVPEIKRSLCWSHARRYLLVVG